MDRQYSAPALKKPAGAAFAGDKLVVTDPSVGGVFIFEPGAAAPRQLGSRGKSETSFREPAGVAAGKNGRLYVLDGAAGRVSVLDTAGTLLFSFGY